MGPDVSVEHWSELGACDGMDGDVFFENPPAYAQTVCRRCPVQAECLEHALLTGEEWGVWGGWTAPQRDGWLRWPQTRRCIVCDERSAYPRCDTCRGG